MTMMLLLYIINGITPFGNRTILTSDLFHQYAVFIAELCDKFANGESIIYSIQNGLGMPFIGNIVTYMLSPFNLIIVLFGKNNIQSSIAIIILLKTILSAFTFTFAIKRLLKTSNEKLLIPMAILYALSSYFLAYYWNIMWMDALYMLPLIILGIYSLIHEKKFLLYTISLFYSIFVNYYMGFMLCIASCVFYLFFYITKENKFEIKDFIKTSFNFAKWSTCAGIVAIGLLLPGLMLLTNSSATGDTLSTLGLSFSPITFISNHLSFTTVSFRTTTEYGYALPNVYCGLITLLLIPIYFLSKNISKKEKIISAIIIAFFYLSFAFNGLNFIWHALHMPNDLPHRFSYIYIFFILFIAIKGLINVESINKKTLITSTITTTIVLVIFAIISAPNKTALTIFSTILLGAIYIIWLMLYNKNTTKKWLPIALTIVVLLELFIPYKTFMTTYSKDMLYRYETAVKSFQEKIKENNNEFYRMELTEFALLNPSSIYNYYGISSFSSMNYETVSYLQKKLGICSNGQNSNQYLIQTPIYNMMMSVNYLLDTSSTIPVDTNYFTEIFNENGISGYESKYKTNIGFATFNPDKWNYENESPFAVQESFANMITNSNDIYFDYHTMNSVSGNHINITPINDTKYNYTLKDGQDKHIVLSTTISQDGAYYAYMSNKQFAIQYTINDETIIHYGPTSYPYVASLGNLTTGDKIEVKIVPRNGAPETSTIDFYLCSINPQMTEKMHNNIQENGMLIVDEISDTYIKASINSKTEYIYTSIPYDKYWEVYVDGEIIPHEELLQYGGALIGIKTTVGEHTIEFQYNMPLFTITPIMPRVIQFQKEQ